MTDDTTPTPDPAPTPEPTPVAPAEEVRSESVAPASIAPPEEPLEEHPEAPATDEPAVPASPEVTPEAPEDAPAAVASPAEVSSVEPEGAVAEDAVDEPKAETPSDPLAEETSTSDEADPEPVASDATTEPTDASELSEPSETSEQTEPAKPKRTRKPKAVAADEPAPDAAALSTVAEPGTDAATPAAPTEPPPENKKKWYAVKIQSGREESIKSAIERKVKIEGLEQFFGQIVIPVEETVVKKKVKVKNKKTGETTTQEKNVTKYNKKYPGYLFTEVEFNDQILYVFRETSGVGDFVGIPAKKKQGVWENVSPSPMTDREVTAMLTGIPDPTDKKGKPRKTVVKLDFEKGDKVRIRNGAFMGSEGEVKAITEPKDPTETPKVTVVVTFWGRPVDVEVDYWEVDKV